MNLENYFIKQFNNRHIGDDGAVLDGYVYSKDAFFENVHFKRKWLSYFDIAKKSMLVNISDAIAMNADPKYILLSVAMPSHMSKEDMRELANGFKSVASAFGAEIIGGDTISNTKLDITITVISKVKKPLLRSNMRLGYLFAYTGELGKSRKELKKLFNLGSIHTKSKFIDIKLRAKFIRTAQRELKAGMDISDGLLSDIDKIVGPKNMGVKFYKKLPKSIGCSGEEYEMLVAFDKRDKKAVLARAKQSRTKLTIFGEASRGRYFNRCKAHHF